MGQHSTENPEAKIFAIFFRNPSSRSETKGEQTLMCDHCKFKGHHKNECCFLHPHLRPARSRWKGGRQGERQGGHQGLSVEKESEGTEFNRTESNSVIKTNHHISSDQMQHLVEQLSMLLTRDKSKIKINGMLIKLPNLSNNNQ
jgi:hypothetical protein